MPPKKKVCISVVWISIYRASLLLKNASLHWFAEKKKTSTLAAFDRCVDSTFSLTCLCNLFFLFFFFLFFFTKTVSAFLKRKSSGTIQKSDKNSI
ncbi:hypothetical protein BY458DRAFT_508178, partial [Sporodiniella umbellata]